MQGETPIQNFTITNKFFNESILFSASKYFALLLTSKYNKNFKMRIRN